jgi:LytS/YehU family sensor histidine kinase
LEADNEDQLKRQEIARLVRDNELRRLKMNRTKILFAGLGSAALIAFLVFVIWIQRKRFRSDQKAMLLEQKLLRSQMNPHFIFNSLTNIQNFILTEKPDKANIYLSKFAMLVRNILDNSVEEYVVLDKEISTLENYLELQKIRYSGKFDYRIHIADEIDIDSIKIPPMLAQPFIENAIEHGIKHRETPGHIDIRFSLKENFLIFEVEDDGIGRQKAREIAILKDPEHKSMATSLTRERLTNLNRKLKEKIQLEIIDLKNALGEATGTRVMFGIPVGK